MTLTQEEAESLAYDESDQGNVLDPETFWQSRSELATIHQFARARRVAPWAVLGGVLARVVASVPPAVVLPPIIGGRASINMFVAVVGASGAGKGAATAVAEEVLGVRDGLPFTIVTPGSGEGIAHAYVSRRRGGDVEQHSVSVLFDVPEIDTLAGLGERRGSTLVPELRRAWSGEGLGFQYASAEKRLRVPAHGYRLALIAGVQPARAGVLLGDTDGGTPQRFVWVPATDPGAPDGAPPVPAPLGWTPPEMPSPSQRWSEIPVCAPAWATIVSTRLVGLRGVAASSLDAHAPLARLKVAAALGLLAGRLSIEDEDWELARVVMCVSDATRGQVADELARKAAQSNRAAGHAEGERAVIVAQHIESDGIVKVSTWVLGKLAGSPMTGAALRSKLTSSRREYLHDALDRLCEAGQIRRFEDEYRGNVRITYRRT